MKYKLTTLRFAFLAVVMGFVFASCDNSKTYAELLDEESALIDAELSSLRQEGYTVVGAPTDTVFDSKKIYTLNNGVYMIVIDKGDLKDMAIKGDMVSLRYKRLNLSTRVSYTGQWYSPIQIRMGYPTEAALGGAIEMPLSYVGEGAQVQLIVPSKMGPTEEISRVIPFLYTIVYTTVKAPGLGD